MAKPKNPRATKGQERREAFGMAFADYKVLAFFLETPPEEPSNMEVTFKMSLQRIGTPEPSMGAYVLEMRGLLPTDKSDAPPIPIVALKTLTVFSFSGIDSLKKDASGSPVLPEWANATIISIAVGGARGIMLERMGTTIFHRIILPILDMPSLGMDTAIPKEMLHGV